MSKRPPSRSTREKDAAMRFLKSLESKDSKALKYVDPEKYIQHNLHAEDGLPVVRKDGAWGPAITCLRRCSRPCHRSLRSIQGIPELPLGCKATYAPRSGPSAFRGLHCLETSAEALEVSRLAIAHGNRTRNRPVSLTPRRRTPIVDSRGFEAVSDAQRSRRYLTLFPGIRPGRGRDTGEKPTPNWRGASRSGDLDPWDCSNHVREGGPFDALLRGPTRAVSAAAP
jgi:hypothetical protein